MAAAHPMQPTMDQHNDTAVEYSGKLLERHDGGQSENDIRTAWRDFVIQTGIVSDERQFTTEVPPGDGAVQRVDLRVGNTYVEFKRQIFVNGQVDVNYLNQLDGYLLKSLQSGWGIQNGLLTDGKNYLKRDLGEHILPIAKNAPKLFQHPGQGPNLREYLRDIIHTDAQNITPSTETLTQHLGSQSNLFRQAAALLTDAHHRHRDNPTVAVKRKLWQELLQVALGQDSTGDPATADWLFVRHTYLTTLTSLILQASFNINVVDEAERNPIGLINGDTLNLLTNLKGVIESDLFQWPSEIGETQYIKAIAKKVMQFDWTQRIGELAATLYQNTILAEERRKMGEYYTPQWLAQSIVEELVDDPLNTVAMDPSCGSGTFIECLAQRTIAAAKDAGLTPPEILDKLQTNIIGIDLHPVAVQLAKATWVLSSGEVISAARQAGHRAAITPPVHLGDSLQLRYDRRTLFSSEYIILFTNEYIDGEAEAARFQIPMSLARNVDRFDLLMLDLAAAIDGNQDTGRVLDNHDVTGDPEREMMAQTAAQMRRLHAQNRNHVWAYYLRNMVRPAVIAEQKVNIIVGNPPWQTYSRSADIVREELENLCQDTYGIWAGGKNSANQDVAAMFFCRVTDLYLGDGGKIGMVLPHSALRTGQHLKWRTGYWQNQKGRNKTAISVNFRVNTPWDLDNLEPNTFFPMPSSVIFAQRIGKYSDLKKGQEAAQSLAPAEVEIWRGPTDSLYVTRQIEPLHHDDGQFHSPYAEVSMRGADIFDRRLYFVTANPSTGLLAMPDTYVTQPRNSSQDKKKYDISGLQGNIIHDDNLFDIYLSETMAPYIALTPAKAVLPINKATMIMPLDHSNCPKDKKTGKVKHIACRVDVLELDERMQYRWPIMESLWDANKGKSDNKSLTQNLNWMNKLASQLEYLREPSNRPVRIAYTAIGRPTAALIDHNKAILDTSTYQVSCVSRQEAHYLLAIINSDALAYAAKPFCTTNWAHKIRNLHKLHWKLPIPAYDGKNPLHSRLSELGEAATVEAKGIIGGLEKVTGTTADNAMRHQWQPASPTAQAIEGAVAALLQG